MSDRAEGTFTVAGWDETTYQELDGKGKLTKARMTFDFAGGVQGQGVSETLMCYREDGTAVFTGLQRMDGKVVEGSGTGELTGLRGTGSAVAGSTPPGTFTFDYELG